MKKFLSIFIAIAMVMTFATAFANAPTTLAATTWYVDASVSVSGDGTSPGTAFKTITEGITAANYGDVINVAPGIYTEQVTVNKSITLQGYSMPTINVSGYTAGNGITITADNVTIDGFNIIGIPTNESGTDEEVYYAEAHVNKWETINIGGSDSAGGISNVVVKNCQFTVNSGDKGHIAMYVHDNCSNITFTGNTVTSYLRGIYAHNNVNNLTVHNNEFNIVSFQRDNMTLWGVTFNYTVGQGIGLNYGKNFVVTGNVFNGPGTFPVRGQDPNGVCNVYAIADFISWFVSSPTADYVINFSGNKITNFYLGMATFAPGGHMSNNNIDSNLLGIQIGQYSATWATGAAQAVTISGNNITNNMEGIWVRDFVAGGIGAHYNNIVGNTDYGIINNDPNNDVFDANNNWWGDASGPYNATSNPSGTGDVVSNNVTFDPWIGKVGTATAGTVEGVTGGTVTANSTEISENGNLGISVETTTNSSGPSDVMLVKYSGNTTNAGFAASFNGSYYDLNVTSPGNISEIIMKLYYPASHGSLTPFWFNTLSGEWEECSIWTDVSGAVTVGGVSYAGYVAVTVNNSTVPSLNDLTGTYFALGGPIYTITASAGKGGSISPSGAITVYYGDSQTFTITADSGYKINRILVDGTPIHITGLFTQAYTFTNVTTNHTISAIFVLKPIPIFTVKASVSVYGGYATVTPKEQTVQQGLPASVTINPDVGYHITGLADNDNNVPLTKLVKNANGTYTYVIDSVYEDHNIVVTLERNKYTIKAKAGEGGTISPLGTITVKYNSTRSFTITPDSGYKIDKIIVDGKPVISSEQKYTFINIKANHTIEATFVKAPAKTSLIITLQINNPDITINGISKPIDPQNSKPVIRNNRTLLPIRVLIESLGGTISWNEKTREVAINLNGHIIVLTIGSNTALVDGIKTQIDPNNSKVTPIIINGRTYLPLRFISEELGAVVNWNGNTQIVTIYYWP